MNNIWDLHLKVEINLKWLNICLCTNATPLPYMKLRYKNPSALLIIVFLVKTCLEVVILMAAPKPSIGLFPGITW